MADMAQLNLDMLRRLATVGSQYNVVMSAIQAYKAKDYAQVLEYCRQLVQSLAQSDKNFSKMADAQTSQFTSLGSVLDFLKDQNTYPTDTMDAFYNVRKLAKAAYKDPSQATEQNTKEAMQDIQNIYSYLDRKSNMA